MQMEEEKVPPLMKYQVEGRGFHQNLERRNWCQIRDNCIGWIFNIRMDGGIDRKREEVARSLGWKLSQLEGRDRELSLLKAQKSREVAKALSTLSSTHHPLIQEHLSNLILDYSNCLENKDSSKCNLKDLTGYLKNQQSLSMTIADYLLNLQNDEITNYHDLINSNNYNLTLASLTLERLEGEIEYLESNVMSGKTFIYKPKIDHSTLSVQDISKELEQLQRVIMLHPHCSIDPPPLLQSTIHSQYLRQKQVYQTISHEIKEISTQTSTLKDIHLQDLTLPEQRNIPSGSKRRKEEIVGFVEFNEELIHQRQGYQNQRIDKMYQEIERIREVLVSRELRNQ